MDDRQLPATDWDVLVHGTGVKPSLLAAALSRAGKKVLQLDANDFYGGNEAAFAIDELEAWAAGIPAAAAASSGSGTSGSTGNSSNSSLSAFSHASTERRTAIGRPRAYTLTLAPHLVYWDSDLLRLLRDADMTASLTWQAVGSFWVWLSDAAVAQRPAVAGGLGGVLAEAGAKAARVGGTIRRKGGGGGWNKGRKHKSLQLDSELFDGKSGGGGDREGKGEGEGGGEEEGRGDAGQTQLPDTKPAAGFSALRRLGDLREVPCTFEDVAWSADLLDRDRGYLGGFLRFVSKCADPDDAKHRQLLHGTKASLWLRSDEFDGPGGWADAF